MAGFLNIKRSTNYIWRPDVKGKTGLMDKKDQEVDEHVVSKKIDWTDPQVQDDQNLRMDPRMTCETIRRMTGRWIKVRIGFERSTKVKPARGR